MSDKVVSLRSNEWLTADELADRLGVSVRTIYNRLKRGEVEKTETPGGARYRLTSTESGESTEVHETATESTASGALEGVTESALKERTEIFSEMLSVIQSLQNRLDNKSERIAMLEHDRGRLRAQVEQLTAQADDADELRDELTQARARLHVAEGRREMTNERADRLGDELEDARAELDRLRRKLDDQADDERTGFGLGSLFGR